MDASEFEAWADRFSKDDKEAALERARAFTENMIRGHRNEARVARLLQRAGLEIILFEPSLLPQYQAQSPDIAIVLPGERVIIVECKSKTRVQDYVEEPTNDGFYRDYPDSLLLCDVNRWQQHTRAQRRWCSEHGYELIDTVAVIELPMLPDAALVEAKADELGWSIEDVENDTLFLSGYIVVDGSTVSDWETVNVSNRWSNGDNRVYSVPSHLFLSMEELIDHAREQMHTKPRLKRGNR